MLHGRAESPRLGRASPPSPPCALQGMRRALAERLQDGVPGQVLAEQGLAGDALYPMLLRRSGFRARLKPGVRSHFALFIEEGICYATR
jgi:hypothetical protein